MRIGLILSLLPFLSSSFYVPFMELSTSQASFDPWALWVENGGSMNAFPYGYVSWLTLAPLSLIFNLTGLPIDFAYGLTLLIIDLALLLVLNKLLPNKENLLILTYWLSPILIFTTYVLGLNDLIPVFFLTFSLYTLSQKKWLISGFLLAASLSSKISMLIAVPFFFFYFINNKPLQFAIKKFTYGFFIGCILFFIPFLVSLEAINMLLGNPQIQEVFKLSIIIGDSVLYFVPLLYIVFLYVVWRFKRLNFQLLMASIGVVFLSLVLLTMSSPGWFVWAIPFLVFYQLNSGKISIILTLVFSILFVINYIFSSLYTPPSIAFEGLPLLWLAYLDNLDPASLYLFTFIFGLGALLAIRFWRESVVKNIFFRLSRRPFVIGIAGDSGSGKDTLVDSLIKLFGSNAVSYLTGDDYHLWDRNKPMWKAITHLNPMANDLERYSDDLLSLVDGKTIQTRHYDHSTGMMSYPIKLSSNDFIITAGLHALYLPISRDCYDLSIYLDIDEDLRKFLKLKRDVHERGSTKEKVIESIEKRKNDSVKFIRKQIEHADLVLSLLPTIPLPQDPEFFDHEINYKLRVKSKMELNELSLRRVLVSVCGLKVDIISGEGSVLEIEIDGDARKEDINEAFRILFPELNEFLAVSPQWLSGTLGIMQLVIISHMNQAFKKRTI